jgi:hypothetical protein
VFDVEHSLVPAVVDTITPRLTYWERFGEYS